MPDPKRFKNKEDFMAACMHKVKKEEGKPQDQSVAQCLNMWERRNKKKKKKKASKAIRMAELADQLDQKGLITEADIVDYIISKTNFQLN